jgi:hypothetical protein
MANSETLAVPLLVLTALVFAMCLVPTPERFTDNFNTICNDPVELPDISMPNAGAHRLATDKYRRIRDSLLSEDVHSPPDMPKALYGAQLYSHEQLRDAVPQKYAAASSSSDAWASALSQADIDSYGPDKFLANSSYAANQVFSSMLMDCDTLSAMPGGAGRAAGAMVCGLQAMALSGTRGGATQEAAVTKLRRDSATCKAQEIVPGQTLQSRYPYYWTCMKANARAAA